MNDNHFPISNFCFGNVVNPKRQCKFWVQGLNLRGFSFSSVLEFSFWSRSFSHELAMILTLQLWHFFVRRESRANNWLNFVFWNGLFSNFYRNLVCESFALIAATATHVTVNVHQLEKYLEKTMKFFFQTANCWESEWTNFLGTKFCGQVWEAFFSLFLFGTWKNRRNNSLRPVLRTKTF